MRSCSALILLVVLAACGRGTADGAKATEALRQVREEHRRAHFDRKASLLVESLADDFRSIQGGAVAMPKRHESLAQFQAYFDATTFLAWDDIEPPVIGLSDDGTLAYVVAHKRVVIKPKDAAADVTPSETIFSWLETWRNVDGAWKLEAIASTSTPETESKESLEKTGAALADRLTAIDRNREARARAELLAPDYVGVASPRAGFARETCATTPLATGVILVTEDGTSAAGARCRLATVWVKDGSRWRLAFEQESALNGAPR